MLFVHNANFSLNENRFDKSNNLNYKSGFNTLEIPKKTFFTFFKYLFQR